MQLSVMMLLILISVSMAAGETYRWVSDKGVIGFTDDPSRIPSWSINDAPRIPSRQLTRQQAADEVTKRRPDLQKRSKSPKKRQPVGRAESRVKAAPAVVQQKPIPLVMQSEVKGHLGGDQTDPAPPSMKQPKSLPMGPQPPPTSSGMEQPDSKL